MGGVASAPTAVLAQLQPIRIVALVLLGGVVALAALAALQGNYGGRHRKTLQTKTPGRARLAPVYLSCPPQSISGHPGTIQRADAAASFWHPSNSEAGFTTSLQPASGRAKDLGVSRGVIVNLSTLSETGLDQWLAAELHRTLGPLGVGDRSWPELPFAPGSPGRPGFDGSRFTRIVRLGAGAVVLTAAAGGMGLASQGLGQRTIFGAPSISSSLNGQVPSSAGTNRDTNGSSLDRAALLGRGQGRGPTGRHRYDVGLVPPHATGLAAGHYGSGHLPADASKRPSAADSASHRTQGATQLQPPSGKETHR